MDILKYTPKIITYFIQKPYGPPVVLFLAGAGLELFMVKFHVGKANIYRSIERNLSNEFARNRFELEKNLVESKVDS